jgi:hypothetical protein
MRGAIYQWVLSPTRSGRRHPSEDERRFFPIKNKAKKPVPEGRIHFD